MFYGRDGDKFSRRSNHGKGWWFYVENLIKILGNYCSERLCNAGITTCIKVARCSFQKSQVCNIWRMRLVVSCQCMHEPLNIC
jgi:hypothetical protein